jgi:uncharacterized protein (TIGR03437 family)
MTLQTPWELAGQTSVQVKVSHGATDGKIYGRVATIAVADYSPTFFEIGGGMVAAQDAAFQLITAGHPVERGQTATLYASGLGPVTNAPASGEPAAVSPSSEIPHGTPVTVTIGGQQAEVLSAGLAPGLPGLYRINVRIPSGITAGRQPATAAIGGKTSKASSIAVR